MSTRPDVEGENGHEALTIPTADGFELAGELRTPADGPVRAAVVVHSATAVARRYYASFARHLAGRGFAVLTYDYRGIGGSRPASLRGFRATMSEWAQKDTAGALALLRSRFPDRKHFAVGHSFGGQTLGFVPAAAALDGAVLVAAQSGYWGHWPGISRWRMFLNWYFLLPSISRLAGYFPGRLGMGEDLPRDVALEWSRWCRHPEYAFGYVEDADVTVSNFRAPLLAFSFADDDYAPRRSVEALLGHFSAAHVEHRHLEPGEGQPAKIGHFGFFRKSHERLWETIIGWLDGAT